MDDRTALEHLLEQWEAERHALQPQIAALQGRVSALGRAIEAGRALLEVPEPEQLAFEGDPKVRDVTEVVLGGREVEHDPPPREAPPKRRREEKRRRS